MNDALRPDEVRSALEQAGVRRGDPVGLVLRDNVGLGLAAHGRCWSVATARPADVVADLEGALRPRWVWWSAAEAATTVVTAGGRVATCWDVAAAHRLLAGGSSAAPAQVWAALHRLDPDSVPRTGQLDLLAPAATGTGGDPECPVDEAGHLRAEWADGGWARTPGRMAAWAEVAVRAHDLQHVALRGLEVGGDPVATAQVESAAELLCVELGRTGLPLDRAVAETLLTDLVGPRPTDPAHDGAQRRARDQLVLRHVASTSDHDHTDLRNPAHVRTALAGVGIDLPDTRSWRLEPW
ncbi:MAG: DNA polymerase I, partial [Actinomycetota bacterium]